MLGFVACAVNVSQLLCLCVAQKSSRCGIVNRVGQILVALGWHEAVVQLPERTDLFSIAFIRACRSDGVAGVAGLVCAAFETVELGASRANVLETVNGLAALEDALLLCVLSVPRSVPTLLFCTASILASHACLAAKATGLTAGPVELAASRAHVLDTSDGLKALEDALPLFVLSLAGCHLTLLFCTASIFASHACLAASAAGLAAGKVAPAAAAAGFAGSLSA